jgi:hypothetical protein
MGTTARRRGRHQLHLAERLVQPVDDRRHERRRVGALGFTFAILQICCAMDG